MNPTRLALQVVGFGLILLAAAILYYQTPLRNDIPEGVALGTLVLMLGVFVLLIAGEARRDSRYSRERVVVDEVDRLDRPARPRRVREIEQDTGTSRHHVRDVEVERYR